MSVIYQIQDMKQFKLILLSTTATFFIFNYIGQSLPSYVPTNDVTAWWSFENSAIDLSQNGHDGIVNGAISINDRSGNGNSAYNFQGFSSHYIQVQNSSKLNFNGGDDYSIAFWIKIQDNPANGPHSGVLSKWTENQNTTSYPYRVGTTDLGNGSSEIVWVNYDNSTQVQNTLPDTITNKRYHHVVYIMRSNEIFMYVNGAFKKSMITQNGTFQNDSDVFIGKRNVSGPRSFKGTLDEMGIWSRALTECEVKALYFSSPLYNNNVDLDSNNGLLTVNSNGQNNSYQWFECTDTGIQNIAGATNSLYQTTSMGYYGVEVTMEDEGCTHVSECIEVGSLNTINEEELVDDNDVSFYPNPATNSFKIDFLNPIDITPFHILDNTGRIIKEGIITNDSNEVEIKNLAPGNYNFVIPSLHKHIKFVVVK